MCDPACDLCSVFCVWVSVAWSKVTVLFGGIFFQLHSFGIVLLACRCAIVQHVLVCYFSAAWSGELLDRQPIAICIARCWESCLT